MLPEDDAKNVVYVNSNVEQLELGRNFRDLGQKNRIGQVSCYFTINYLTGWKCRAAVVVFRAFRNKGGGDREKNVEILAMKDHLDAQKLLIPKLSSSSECSTATRSTYMTSSSKQFFYRKLTFCVKIYLLRILVSLRPVTPNDPFDSATAPPSPLPHDTSECSSVEPLPRR